MKKDIHPQSYDLIVKIGDDTFTTKSTSKKGEMLMDIDYRKHPAWTKKATSASQSTNKNIQKFNKKFAGMPIVS